MFKWLQKASATLPSVLRSMWSGSGIYPPAGQTQYLTQYTVDPWLYAAVWILATSAARSPCWIRKKNGDIMRDHALLTLLEQPNEEQSAFDFWEASFSFLELGGETFWEIVRATIGAKPTELWNLRPDRMYPIPSDDLKRISGYEYRVGSAVDIFDAKDIVHIRNFNPIDDFRGLATVEPMKAAIVTDSYGWRFAERFMKRDGVPVGHLQTERNAGTFTSKRLGDSWSSKEDEQKNKTPLLPPGLTYEKDGTTPKDGGVIELLKMLRESKNAPTGVPPVLLGLVESARYANYDMQLRAFHRFTLEPKLMKLEGAINRKLLPLFYPGGRTGGAKFEFDKRLTGFIDIAAFVKSLGELFDRAVLSPNDIIRLTGLGETYEDGGNDHYLGERKHTAADSESAPTPASGDVGDAAEVDSGLDEESTDVTG